MSGTAPVLVITVGPLAKALGTSRSSVLRAVASKRIPKPDAKGRAKAKTWRAWKPETAAAIVGAAKKSVPRAWVDAAEAERGAA